MYDILNISVLYGTDDEVSIHKPQERHRGTKLDKQKRKKMKEKQQWNCKCQQYDSVIGENILKEFSRLNLHM